ncbi:MAG: class I tRNA ligase family protein, partial [Saprospiraceae bacterium]|nr:class I tRNA ligase family protein [Saprospiraceae bacterium]
ETAVEALEQARAKTGNSGLQLSDLKQEEDVVDTWFSSWLWPMAVFDGFENPEELKYYYPTNVLVTGWDIMFFWVARMIMSGYEYSEELLGKELVESKGRQPFHDVFFTGMVRDNKRRKMSKSLGNSPDALALIENYGADGVRFGMLSSASAGNDIIFDAPFDPITKEALNESKLCEQGRNFCNKMWNAMILVKGWELEEGAADVAATNIQELALSWIENKFEITVALVEDHFRTYRLSDALMALYSFIWEDFCSWYLEMIKPGQGENISRAIHQRTVDVFSRMMSLLHPFMPFITEEIWHQLRVRASGEDCVVSKYPVSAAHDASLVKMVDRAKDVVRKVREIRNSKGVKNHEVFPLYGQKSKELEAFLHTPGISDMILKMARLESIEITEQEIEHSISFIAGTDQFYLDLKQEVDAEQERAKLEEELKYYQGFVQSVQKKLSNERFVANAPEAVVAMERKKMADGEAKIGMLKESLAKLN